MTKAIGWFVLSGLFGLASYGAYADWDVLVAVKWVCDHVSMRLVGGIWCGAWSVAYLVIAFFEAKEAVLWKRAHRSVALPERVSSEQIRG